ncbi:MAG: type II CRISPR RNA-guided endonuclease Cas9 [Rhodocyclales bacterium]|nr:type II CRISPR RNA-guided endonuclease Cas9 [Rhodocyclales bacterium]
MGNGYTLGLDIGIASVGWCLLGHERILDLGVRAFDKAETAKEGDPLNLIRRQARLARHRLAQRAWRLKRLTRVLKQHGLIDDKRFFLPDNPARISPWRLRVEGLDRLLSRDEWARVIFHVCKHRGFHWVSRAEEKQAEGDAKGEGGRVKQGLLGTRKLMEEKRYRSAAEMVLAEFSEVQRNKQGEYSKALSRIVLGDELKTLFACQRRFGSTFATVELETTVLGHGDCKSGLFWQQKPALSGGDLLSMLGKCTFENSEYRAPKASFTAERHVWLTRLNNLRIVCDGRTRPLDEAERAVALPLPYQQAGDFTYKQLGSALVKAGLLPKDGFKFAGLSYPSEAQKTEGKGKDPEGATLVKLPAWQELRSVLKKAGLETEWEGLAGAACDGRPETLDQIARILSVYKDDEEARAELNKLTLPSHDQMVEALLDIRFGKFHALSLKALYKIVPLMEQGLRYDEACAAAGYHHSQLHKAGEGRSKLLPPFYSGRSPDGRMRLVEDADVPRNPVVLRALNQARKVVNAIVRRYGSPMTVNIEMARDLSRPLDERNKIKKEQEDYQARNERDKALFAEEFGQPPRGGEFEKFRLYREQLGKCAYSQMAIELERLLEPGYVEIDHALPYSRSFDDSKNNKVLALAKENRNKGNLTPYEYLGGTENSPRWQQFVAFVESTKAYRLAKRSRLLRKEFGPKEADEFKERNLNDTRYICRFFKSYVERHLELAEGSEAKRCVVLSGQTTAFLRARWGINKIRSESDRHHALDAAVVAACTHGMVKRLADHSRARELAQVREGFVDQATGEIVNPAMYLKLKHHFPEPWPHFRHELDARLKIEDPATLRDEMARFGTYDGGALEQLRPLFVSRAVQRRNGGAAHKDTIYGQSEALRSKGGVTQKVPLSSLTMKDLDKLIDPHRNAKLYGAIRERLEAHDGKGEKAFPTNDPLRKPGRDGNPSGPVVRTVTVVIDKLSGIPVRGGIAKNDSMLRVDVFAKDGKFHLVPVYVHHRVTGLPNRAIVQGREEDSWTEIDHSFAWCFSLYPNDLVRITLKAGGHFGYYASTDRSTGAISIWAHDRDQTIGKDGLIRSIGVKTALNVEKFHVDLLGNIYPSPAEPRRGVA